jgi:hypothetical protein
MHSIQFSQLSNHADISFMTSSTLTSDPDRLKQVNEEVARIQRHQKAERYDEAGQFIDALLNTALDHPQLGAPKGVEPDLYRAKRRRDGTAEHGGQRHGYFGVLKVCSDRY